MKKLVYGSMLVSLCCITLNLSASDGTGDNKNYHLIRVSTRVFEEPSKTEVFTTGQSLGSRHFFFLLPADDFKGLRLTPDLFTQLQKSYPTIYFSSFISFQYYKKTDDKLSIDIKVPNKKEIKEKKIGEEILNKEEHRATVKEWQTKLMNMFPSTQQQDGKSQEEKFAEKYTLFKIVKENVDTEAQWKAIVLFGNKVEQESDIVEYETVKKNGVETTVTKVTGKKKATYTIHTKTFPRRKKSSSTSNTSTGGGGGDGNDDDKDGPPLPIKSSFSKKMKKNAHWIALSAILISLVSYYYYLSLGEKEEELNEGEN